MQILVIGAGVIGITSALALLERGHDVTIVSRDFPPNTTSDRAAAIWWPDLAIDAERATPEYRQRVVQWARASWKRYRALSDNPAYGLRPEVCRILSTHRPVEPVAADVVESSSIRHTPELPGALEWTWEFTSLLIEMPRYLPRLMEDVYAAGGRTIQREVASWQDAVEAIGDTPPDLVVNCTGLGSRKLAGDGAMVPVRGQLILVRPQPVGYKLTAEWEGRSIYWMARSDALVLGGSYEVGEESDVPTEEEIEAIWRAHESWIRAGAGGFPAPVLRRDDIVGRRAGLRPYRREGIRLELERIGVTPVIHNYGHGGCGISLSWGCAEEVAALAEVVGEGQVGERLLHACAAEPVDSNAEGNGDVERVLDAPHGDGEHAVG